MDRQHNYRSAVLDHRGFVAGMFDELGIIDQATPQHPETGLVTAGHAVNAMVLKGLGLVNQPLASCLGCSRIHRPLDAWRPLLD